MDDRVRGPPVPSYTNRSQSPCSRRMNLTKSRAHSNPPSVASHFSWPCGVTLKATMFRTCYLYKFAMPDDVLMLDVTRQVHVRLRPMAFIFRVRSIVNPEVEPPAPQVMSQNKGVSLAS